MWQIFNTFICKVLPLLPSFIIWQVAKRYVAGKNKKDALDKKWNTIVLKALNDDRFKEKLVRALRDGSLPITQRSDGNERC